jgi:hypothetical protein
MFLIVGLIIFGLVVIWHLLMAYIMLFSLDQIEGSLTSATWILPVKKMHGGKGWVCRLHRVTMIVLLFALPRVFINRGEVNATELSQVPQSLKRLILGAYALGVVIIIVVVALCISLKMAKQD